MPEVGGRPQLVATDLDGTLLRSDGSLSQRSASAIAGAQDAGILTVFVTARPPRWLHELAASVGAHGVAICANGALVYDVTAREVITTRALEHTLLLALERDLRAVVPDVTFAVERADGMAREDRFAYRRELGEDRTGAFASIVDRPVGKLLARSESMDPAEFHATVSRVLGERAELGYSGAVGLAEITAKGVTKAAGLAGWCAERGIDAAGVWAFGDMPNDLPMLAWAGRSFAVANAHPQVLDAVDHVVGLNDDDAVAAVLEGLVRQRR